MFMILFFFLFFIGVMLFFLLKKEECYYYVLNVEIVIGVVYILGIYWKVDDFGCLNKGFNEKLDVV